MPAMRTAEIAEADSPFAPTATATMATSKAMAKTAVIGTRPTSLRWFVSRTMICVGIVCLFAANTSSTQFNVANTGASSTAAAGASRTQHGELTVEAARGLPDAIDMPAGLTDAGDGCEHDHLSSDETVIAKHPEKRRPVRSMQAPCRHAQASLNAQCSGSLRQVMQIPQGGATPTDDGIDADTSARSPSAGPESMNATHSPAQNGTMGTDGDSQASVYEPPYPRDQQQKLFLDKIANISSTLLRRESDAVLDSHGSKGGRQRISALFQAPHEDSIANEPSGQDDSLAGFHDQAVGATEEQSNDKDDDDHDISTHRQGVIGVIGQEKEQHSDGEDTDDEDEDSQITEQSDLTRPGRYIHVVTTAALPWMTGTAVNPLLRAAYLHRQLNIINGGGPARPTTDGQQNEEIASTNSSIPASHSSWVTLVIPWLELHEDQRQVYGKELFETPQEQEEYIRNWLRKDGVGLADAADSMQIVWYPARYHAGMGSVFAMGDIIDEAKMPESERDVCILEEPEHCNWFRAPGDGWTKKYNYVVGIIHTNYKEYAANEFGGLWTAPALELISSAMIRAYTHKILKLSDVLQSYAAEKEVTENVHGVRSDFIQREPLPHAASNRDDGSGDGKSGNGEQPKKVYFIGKLVWAKGFDLLLDYQEYGKEVTGEYFPIDIFGSGPDSAEIERAFIGRKRLSSNGGGSGIPSSGVDGMASDSSTTERGKQQKAGHSSQSVVAFSSSKSSKFMPSKDTSKLPKIMVKAFTWINRRNRSDLPYPYGYSRTSHKGSARESQDDTINGDNDVSEDPPADRHGSGNDSDDRSDDSSDDHSDSASSSIDALYSKFVDSVEKWTSQAKAELRKIPFKAKEAYGDLSEALEVIAEKAIVAVEQLPTIAVDSLDQIIQEVPRSLDSLRNETIEFNATTLEAIQAAIKEKLDMTKTKIVKLTDKVPRSWHEFRRQAIPATFPGRVDHAALRDTDYSIFVNPSISEVLCTTTFEALAMGKFVIIPVHPSNTFFLQFPNCLAYNNKMEFVANLWWALSHDPAPLTDELRHAFTWEAATLRLMQAAAITKQEALEREQSGKFRLDSRIAWFHNELGKGVKGDVIRKVFGAGPVSDQVKYLKHQQRLKTQQRSPTDDRDGTGLGGTDTDLEGEDVEGLLSRKFWDSTFVRAIREAAVYGIP